MYAYVKMKEEHVDDVIAVYNFDGPGFLDKIQETPRYLATKEKIYTFVPSSSIVGMLLEHEEPYTVIKSSQIGIMQHDPYSWQILGPNFCQVEELTANSRLLDRTFKNWLSKMSNEERSAFFDTVFELLESTGAAHTGELIRPQNVRSYLKTLQTNDSMRNLLASELASLLLSAREVQNPTDA